MVGVPLIKLADGLLQVHKVQGLAEHATKGALYHAVGQHVGSVGCHAADHFVGRHLHGERGEGHIISTSYKQLWIKGRHDIQDRE